MKRELSPIGPSPAKCSKAWAAPWTSSPVPSASSSPWSTPRATTSPKSLKNAPFLSPVSKSWTTSSPNSPSSTSLPRASSSANFPPTPPLTSSSPLPSPSFFCRPAGQSPCPPDLVIFFWRSLLRALCNLCELCVEIFPSLNLACDTFARGNGGLRTKGSTYEGKETKTPPPQASARQRRNEAMVSDAGARARRLASRYDPTYVWSSWLLSGPKNFRCTSGYAGSKHSQFAALQDGSHAAGFTATSRHGPAHCRRKRTARRTLAHFRGEFSRRLARRPLVAEPGLQRRKVTVTLPAPGTPALLGMG